MADTVMAGAEPPGSQNVSPHVLHSWIEVSLGVTVECEQLALQEAVQLFSKGLLG